MKIPRLRLYTRAPAPFLELSSAVLFAAWGAWMVAAPEPDPERIRMPLMRSENPRLCLAALMPLWVWGSTAILLGLWRALTINSMKQLRWSALGGCMFWTLAVMLHLTCVPGSAAIPVYAYLAHLSGVTTIIASRKMGENGAGGHQ